MKERERLLIVGAINSLNINELENAVFDNNALNALNIQTFLPEDKAKRLTIECDGLCEPPPNGIGCWAFIVFDSNRNIIHS